ncbi:MAG: right-handed parallel beta-helix repeat-containing protein [Pirellulales bacterium]|nr:right-handed parallel beta-helix repeat-containing protein [Pirellulales bacterium]
MLSAYLVDSLDDTMLDDGLTTLREALEAADTNTALWADGDHPIVAGSDTETDTITFDPDLFTNGVDPVPGTILFAPDQWRLEITDPAGVDLQGPGPELLSIDADGRCGVLFIESGAEASLSEITLTHGGHTSLGGGITNYGTLSISHSIISNSSATSTLSPRGGGIYNAGQLSIDHSTISGNSSISSCTDQYNKAYGGGVYNGGTLSITDSTISDNSATVAGYFAYGGGLCNDGVLSISHSTISGNSVSNEGGSTAYCGGGGLANCDGTTTIAHSIISDNSATGQSGCGGGAVFVDGGAVTIDHSTVSGNWATYNCGGVFNYAGETTVSHSTISGNSASNAGGLLNLRDLVVINSTVSNNSATGAGGGMAAAYSYGASPTLQVVNSTISGNSATMGGGIYSVNSSTNVSITNSTITDNSATNSGGGLYASSSQILMHNSVIAENDAGDNAQIHATVLPQSSHNLIGVSTGLSGIAHGENGNQIGAEGSPIDPMLDPLQDNGGPTLTHAPLAGSPLIDAGDDAKAIDPQWEPLLADQRGFSRFFGTVDIGAVEDQPPGMPVAQGDAFVGNQDEPIVLDVLANDFCQTGTMEVELVEGPSHGLLVENLDGTLTYTPDPDFWGVDIFSYRAVNDPWTSNTVEVFVSVLSPVSIVVTTASDETNGDLSADDISLREALQMATPGAAIQFSADLLGQTIYLTHLTGTLIVADVQIVGPGAGYLAIDGYLKRVLDVDGDSLIAHLTITGGFVGIETSQDAVVTIDHCSITDNGDTTYLTGGIYNRGTMTIIDSKIVGNAARETMARGGGICNYGTLDVSGSIISHNSAGSDEIFGSRGGGIFNGGTLTVADSVFSNNTVAYAGGAIANYHGTLTVTRCDFLDNVSECYAGAIDNCPEGVAVIDDSYFSGNVAVKYLGGAISTGASQMTIMNSTITGNSATGALGPGDGGGIAFTSGTLTILNSVIANNDAAGFGGGLYVNASESTLVIRNSTITGNTAALGGGVAYMGQGTQATIANSIIAMNDAPTDPDFYGTLPPNGGFNLIGVDPGFVGSEDFHLAAGSPAIHAGSDALAVDAEGHPLATDLDGNPRSVGPSVDMGAFEFQYPLSPQDQIPGDANLDGTVNAVDAQILAAHWGLIPTCLLPGDANDDWVVDHTDAEILAAHWGEEGVGWEEGDFDGDDAVGPGDAAILAAHWGTAVGMRWADGDFDGDKIVGPVDASILAAHWGMTFAPPGEEAFSESTAPLGDGSTPASDPLIGPVQKNPDGLARWKIAPVARKNTPPSEAAAAAAACDAAMAEQYGPRAEPRSLQRERLAFSHALARRQARSQENPTDDQAALAVDLLLKYAK